jgi:hypothetical protein
MSHVKMAGPGFVNDVTAWSQCITGQIWKTEVAVRPGKVSC